MRRTECRRRALLRGRVVNVDCIVVHERGRWSSCVGGEIDAGPDVFVLAMFDAQAVEDVGCVEAGVVAELARNDLECFGKGFDDRLLFVGHVAVGELV